MTISSPISSSPEDSGWLLALHSSSEQLGVAVLPWPEPPGSAPLAAARLQAFATGRDLANQLLLCLEALLPAPNWPRLQRLAVATGPGGFTSTRLTVVLARTLAQQQNLPLDSRSSYHLNALRLWRQGDAPTGPFWLFQDLPRRGRVAGLYGPDPSAQGTLLELEPPRLQDPQRPLSGPLLAAEPCLPQDVAELLAVCREGAVQQLSAPWSAVVPLYPTGPVPQG
ncbi:MAG: tRNA (adenosine(37)-N6)-threonylcarbamoyltransferase complex dimerization subunit type 1 TsaB [Cyanobium sp.]